MSVVWHSNFEKKSCELDQVLWWWYIILDSRDLLQPCLGHYFPMWECCPNTSTGSSPSTWKTSSSSTTPWPACNDNIPRVSNFIRPCSGLLSSMGPQCSSEEDQAARSHHTLHFCIQQHTTYIHTPTTTRTSRRLMWMWRRGENMVNVQIDWASIYGWVM